MTGKPYTPTTGDIRRCYVTYGRINGPMHTDLRHDEFDRWLASHDAEIEVAAEQRGAEQALQEAAEHVATLPERLGDHPIKSADVSEWLKYRADQLGTQND